MPNLNLSKPSFTPPQVPDLKWTKPNFSAPSLPEVKLNTPNFSMPKLPGRKASKPDSGAAQVVAALPQALERGKLGSKTASEVLLRAQLARTSRQLAQESSELGQAVGSLKATIRADRRKARRARRRHLAGNMALGAVVMYHIDPDQGRQRRQATAKLLKRAADQFPGRKA